MPTPTASPATSQRCHRPQTLHHVVGRPHRIWSSAWLLHCPPGPTRGAAAAEIYWACNPNDFHTHSKMHLSLQAPVVVSTHPQDYHPHLLYSHLVSFLPLVPPFSRTVVFRFLESSPSIPIQFQQSKPLGSLSTNRSQILIPASRYSKSLFDLPISNFGSNLLVLVISY